MRFRRGVKPESVGEKGNQELEPDDPMAEVRDYLDIAATMVGERLGIYVDNPQEKTRVAQLILQLGVVTAEIARQNGSLTTNGTIAESCAYSNGAIEGRRPCIFAWGPDGMVHIPLEDVVGPDLVTESPASNKSVGRAPAPDRMPGTFDSAVMSSKMVGLEDVLDEGT